MPFAGGALEARKARLRERFAAWLDETLAAEEPPAGLAPELLARIEGGDDPEDEAPGLYGLFAAMTGLTQEVRLQGRAFKRLEEAVGPLVERQAQVLEAHGDAIAEASRLAEQAMAARTEREREAVRQAVAAAGRDALLALIDTRERLTRAGSQARPLIEQARSALARPRLLGVREEAALRFVPLPPHPATGRTLDAVAALEVGCRLALDRLAEVLDRTGVRELDCLGRPFDPRRMAAVEVKEADAAEDGTVLEVFRPGYECGGVLVRPAQVSVARRGAGR